MLLPSWRDPRLHVTATIMALHVIGQVWLGFELSIAQILVALATCAAIELVLVAWERKVIAWPASALLTGNGVAFVLRVNGTEHGDWWSMQGWYIFAATSALGLLTKYVVQVAGRQVFNPSNVALVVCFLILGTDRVNPLDFWWGPWSPAMALVYVVLGAGAVLITHRLRLLGIAAAFWLCFAAGLGVVSALGHCIWARWSLTPVCGTDFWWTVVASPEVLVFVLFMITDPKSIPTARGSRLLFGAAVGITAVVLVAPARTEFWAKVAVLASLVVVHVGRAALSARPALSLTLRRPALLAVSLPALLLVAVMVGLHAREPLPQATTPAASAGALAARPAVEIGTLPPVRVDDAVETITGSLTQTEADAMGRQLAESLLIEAKALEEGDDAMLQSAVVGKRLEADRAGAPNGVDRRFSELTAVVVRDPTNPQAIPRLGIHARGTTADDPFDAVFVLARAGSTYLVADELTPQAAGLR